MKYCANYQRFIRRKKDPMVVVKFFDPTGSWTCYACEGSPVDEHGYVDTDKEKGDFLFFGLVIGFEPERGYFSVNELVNAKHGLRGMQARQASGGAILPRQTPRYLYVAAPRRGSGGGESEKLITQAKALLGDNR